MKKTERFPSIKNKLSLTQVIRPGFFVFPSLFSARVAPRGGFASKVDPAWRQAFQPVQITILGRTG
jgi:hypothetical protein